VLDQFSESAQRLASLWKDPTRPISKTSANPVVLRDILKGFRGFSRAKNDFLFSIESAKRRFSSRRGCTKLHRLSPSPIYWTELLTPELTESWQGTGPTKITPKLLSTDFRRNWPPRNNPRRYLGADAAQKQLAARLTPLATHCGISF